MRKDCFSIEEGLLAWVDRVSVNREIPRSELIRRAVKDYLHRETQPIITRRLRIYY